jgi:hypothetical protein
MKEIQTLQDFNNAGTQLDHKVIQNLDFSKSHIDWANYSLIQTVFLGCTFKDTKQKVFLVEKGAMLFPEFHGLPYDPYRQNLYTARTNDRVFV